MRGAQRTALACGRQPNKYKAAMECPHKLRGCQDTEEDTRGVPQRAPRHAQTHSHHARLESACGRRCRPRKATYRTCTDQHCPVLPCKSSLTTGRTPPTQPRHALAWRPHRCCCPPLNRPSRLCCHHAGARPRATRLACMGRWHSPYICMPYAVQSHTAGSTPGSLRLHTCCHLLLAASRLLLPCAGCLAAAAFRSHPPASKVAYSSPLCIWQHGCVHRQQGGKPLQHRAAPCACSLPCTQQHHETNTHAHHSLRGFTLRGQCCHISSTVAGLHGSATPGTWHPKHTQKGGHTHLIYMASPTVSLPYCNPVAWQQPIAVCAAWGSHARCTPSAHLMTMDTSCAGEHRNRPAAVAS